MNQTPNTPSEKKVEFTKKKKKGMRPVVAILIAFGILVVGVGASLAIYLSSVKPPEIVTPKPDEGGNVISPLPPEILNASRREGVYSFLVICMDNPAHSKNTDLLMLCNFDTVTGKVSVMQILRDIYVNDPLMTGEGKASGSDDTICKINNVYNLAYLDYMAKNPGAKAEDAYAYGISYLKNKISEIFAVPIDFHVAFDTNMYRKLLELVCPVTVDVPIDMDYDDPGQDLHIHLKKGVQELNAEQLEGFSRFRQNNDGSSLTEGDATRADLQKIALAAIADKFFSSFSLPNAQAVAGTVLNNVKTDLKLENCVWFIARALELYASGTMTLDTIRMYDLPCYVPGVDTVTQKGYTQYYSFMEKGLGYTTTILNAGFNPTDTEITAEMLGYEEAFPIYYCDHSDTEGVTLATIMTAPPEVGLY